MLIKNIRQNKLVLAFYAVLLALVLSVLIPQSYNQSDQEAEASLVGWNAGNIINDMVMTDKNSMSVAEIQAFLYSKNSCNNTNIAGYVGNPNFHIANGHFVCLAEEIFSGYTAAQVIWNEAQVYSINPQVLLVLLQKEQGLITDTWPSAGQYRTATGYGCPDTAACDSQYYGFWNQVTQAARFYRAYQDNNPSWYKPYWVGTYNIKWHPNNACGSQAVYIENRATASLYGYTPYIPNWAALSANYGTGDGCSSYGNRNFYNYFTDWFGSTQRVTGDFVIANKLSAIGGTSVAGAAQGAVMCGLAKGGCGQVFANGRIFWTQAIGARYISNSIANRWLAMNSVYSYFGYPISDTISLGNGASYQAFENGKIFYSPATGAWDVSGGIYQRWAAMGAEWSALGFPKSSENVNYYGEVYQIFEGGSVYWTSAKGAWVVPNWALNSWLQWGGGRGFLGASLNSGICGIKNNGCYQNFAGGKLYYSSSTGTWDVSGGIFQKWFSIGAEWSALGYPISTEQYNYYGEAYQSFEGGYMFYTSSRGAWVIPSWSLLGWYDRGGIRGLMGQSTNNGICGIKNNGCYQNFESGKVYFSSVTGSWAVSGAIYQLWFSKGAEWSSLGYPISGEKISAQGVTYQQFENGTINYTSGAGAWVA